MRGTNWIIAALLAFSPITAFAADSTSATVATSDGRHLHGIVSEDSGVVNVKTRGGTLTLQKSDIVSITPDPTPVVSRLALPKWEMVMATAQAAEWIMDLRQIPATVIDNGVMKNVPYLSYKSGDFEMNLYGDPESPACVEIGVYRSLLKSDQAKANCMSFIGSLMKSPQQQALLKSLKMEKDEKELDGLTYEVTAPTDPDAYGGWWISVYSTSLLDGARATDAELASISVRRADYQAAKAAATQRVAVAVASDTHPRQWTESDMRSSRPSAVGSTGGGSVYVSGYTRKDGTYVHSYTRNPPGGGRRGR